MLLYVLSWCWRGGPAGSLSIPSPATASTPAVTRRSPSGALARYPAQAE